MSSIFTSTLDQEARTSERHLRNEVLYALKDPGDGTAEPDWRRVGQTFSIFGLPFKISYEYQFIGGHDFRLVRRHMSSRVNARRLISIGRLPNRDLLPQEVEHYRPVSIGHRENSHLRVDHAQSSRHQKALHAGLCDFHVWFGLKSTVNLIDLWNCIFVFNNSPVYYSLQCICLAPTYELALQIGNVTKEMGKFIEGLVIGYGVRGERGIVRI